MQVKKYRARSAIICLALLVACNDMTPTNDAPQPRSHIQLPASLANAERFAAEWLAEDPRMPWSWVEMVLLYGLWHLYEANGDPALLAYVADFAEQQHKGYQPIASDWFSPAVLDMLICEESQTPANCERVPVYDDYFVTCKRETGALVHWTVIEGLDRQLWVDTIFMVGAYMLERARRLEPEAAAPWWDDLTLQFQVFDEYLTDSATGLMNHAYDFAASEPIVNGSGAFWGRGNSWYIAMLGLTLKYLPADHAARPELETLWHERVAALLPLQDEAGYWHTILTAPTDHYPEASATALIAFGLAAGLNAGLSHDGASASAEAALAALDGSISVDNGRLTLPQISTATEPGTVEDYLNVDIESNVAYGLGGYILAALEVARLRGELSDPAAK